MARDPWAQRISINVNRHHVVALREQDAPISFETDEDNISAAVIGFMERVTAGHTPDIELEPYRKFAKDEMPDQSAAIRINVWVSNEQHRLIDELCAGLDIGRAAFIRIGIYKEVESRVMSHLLS